MLAAMALSMIEGCQMKQTPVNECHNPDLLALIPAGINSLVEIGCSSGALAREYKKNNGNSRYIGVDIVPEYVDMARRYCDKVMALDIETADIDFLKNELSADCWIFGDSLEHLRDPWSLLSKIRQIIPQSGCVVACIPNAQHWSVQARLCMGAFRYEDVGLLDRTHLRWFTRVTIMEMFEQAGFKVIDILSRVFNEPDSEKILPSIRAMALGAGVDPELAAADALPFQFVVRAIPVGAIAAQSERHGMLGTIAMALRHAMRRFR
jgi:SAM-dependent methyltransferase